MPAKRATAPRRPSRWTPSPRGRVAEVTRYMIVNGVGGHAMASRPVGKVTAAVTFGAGEFWSRRRGRVYASAVGHSGSGLGAYATLGLLLGAGVVVLGAAMVANRVLRTTVPSEAKSLSYECGLDPVGGDWAQAQIRYYIYAYLYVLFAVEAVFLFPWAVIYNQPGFGRAAIVEMAIFVGVLALGLLYAWRKRVLRWA